MSSILINREKVKAVLVNEWSANMPALFDPVLARMLSRLEDIPGEDVKISAALPVEANGNNAALKPSGLNPCPFCGGEKLNITRTVRHGAKGAIAAYYVRCETCQAHSGIYTDMTKAVEKWNGRNNERG